MERATIFKTTFSVLLSIAILFLSSMGVIGQKGTTQPIIADTPILPQEPLSDGRALLWDNGLPDWTGATLSYANFDESVDYYTIDDFQIPAYPGQWVISNSEFRMIANVPATYITKVNVWFFQSGSYNIPYYSPFKKVVVTDTNMHVYQTGNYYLGFPELAIECTFPEPVVLSAKDTNDGWWWICVQPVMQSGATRWLFTDQHHGKGIFLDWPDPLYQRWTYCQSVYGYLCDVSFRVYGSEPVPDIGFEGSLSWEKVKPGSSVYGSFTVCNVGEPDSLIDWHVVSSPAWGTWAFVPDSGEDLQAGDSVTISVKVTVPNEENTEFTGVVKVINLGDETDYCEIPVVIKTPRTQHLNFESFVARLYERFPLAFPILRHLLGY